MRYSFFLRTRLAGCFLLLLLQTAIYAQQNQKVVFPNPQGFSTNNFYNPPFILNTPDNGWLISTYLLSNDDMGGIPRLIKLDENGQTEWDTTYLNQVTPGFHYIEPLSVLNAPGGGWLMSLRDDSTGVELLRIDTDGSALWTKDIGVTQFGFKLLGVVNNSWYGVAQETAANGFQWRLYQLDLNGNVLSSVLLPTQWSNTFGTYDIILSDGNEVQLYFNKAQNGTIQKYLVRYDLAGNQLWQNQPAGVSSGALYQASANGFYLLSNNIIIYRYDASGNLLSQFDASAIPDVYSIRRVEQYPVGSLLVSGSTVTQRGFMAKLDASYNIL
ncbi:MAG: hypothetical protein KA165_20505, partial [Saprospiraceae bacterium]|nr:hypothetical protein [Saprospiraceae bacterium]